MKNYTFVVHESIEAEDEYDDLELSVQMGGFEYVDGFWDKGASQAKFTVGVAEWGDGNGVE